MRELSESIKKRIKSEFERIRADKELMSRIYLITLATSLLVLAVVIRGPEQKGRIISDKEGNAVSIERYSTNVSENYDLEVAIKDEEMITREINLNLHASGKDSSGLGLTEEPGREALLDAALDSVVSEIEYSRKEKIDLPGYLSDGTEISWKAIDKKDYSLLILIPAIYIALLVFVIRNADEKGSVKELKRRKSIIRGLPRFCNQLFLMMNAGMILSDAFEHITTAYASSTTDDNSDEYDNYFEKELTALRMKDPEHRKSSASIINEFAVRNDVKEMIRIATILTENEKRGSDVIESLSRESRYLWDERKIVARESGKMIDTKMAYPLGILLILLIVITMAPAMLSM